MIVTLIYKTRVGLVIALLVIAQIMWSQESTQVDTLVARMDLQFQIYPQEKIYVHNDKPLYISGEDVWFRAHLVDAYAHLYDSTSLYVYGELINPVDSIVNRVKVRRNNESYAGQFTLPEDYPAGTYTMRFYTRFMESMGDEYFFYNNIEVGGPFSSKYKTNLEYRYSNNNKKLEIVLQFINQETQKKINPQNIAIAYRKEHFRNSSKSDFKIVSLNDEQEVSFTLDVGREPIRSLYIEYEHDGNFHCEFITIAAPSDEFHIDFFPEGGSLLCGQPMNIAFKALSSDGLSIPVHGIIYSEGGDSITSFNTINAGMGLFPLSVEMGKSYYAICKTEDGRSKKVNLPKSLDNGYTLSVQSTSNFFLLSVLAANNVIGDDLVLLMHSKGQVIYANYWNIDDGAFQVAHTELPEGIVHCLLVNKDYQPISERLFFNDLSHSHLRIDCTTNQNKYLRRDKVISNITVHDTEGNAMNGAFSISITDNKDIKVDSTQNIMTNFLLTSELKGYIENPLFYFQNDSISSKALDILMLTQGWRKYNIPQALKGLPEYPKGILEFSQTIRGKVKSGLLLNRVGGKIPINLLSLGNPRLVLTTESDQNGRFLFRTDFPDSLALIIRATTSKGGDRVFLDVDKEVFPALNKNIPRPYFEKIKFNSYFDKADLKYTTALGMRMINLKGIEVIGINKRQNTKRSVYSSALSILHDSRSFERLGARSLRDILTRIGGIRLQGDDAYIRGNTEAAVILVDDIEYNDVLASDPQLNEIESVEVVKDGTAAIFGMRGANGVILVTTKRGDAYIMGKPPINIAKIMPLGYQTALEFYSPKYLTSSQKNDSALDLRTTLYWNPNIRVVDGKAEVSFYTADDMSEYTLSINGITTNGKIIHFIKTIGRNE